MIVSCGQVMAGFVAAAVVGVPMGIAMGTFYSMDSLFAPFVGTVRYMPVTAFVPLIVIWVGLGEESKILIITLGVVLYNAIMIADAVKFIPSEMINVAYTLGATRRDVLFRVIVPASERAGHATSQYLRRVELFSHCRVSCCSNRFRL